MGWAGVAAVTAAVAYIVAVLLIFVSTPPARGGVATLEYIATHRQLYIVKQVLWIAPSLLLLVSLAMLRTPMARPVTYLGIVTGAVGLVGEALRPLLGAGYALAGLLMIAWFLAIGVHLAALALRADGGRSERRDGDRSGLGGAVPR